MVGVTDTIAALPTLLNTKAEVFDEMACENEAGILYRNVATAVGREPYFNPNLIDSLSSGVTRHFKIFSTLFEEVLGVFSNSLTDP